MSLIRPLTPQATPPPAAAAAPPNGAAPPPPQPQDQASIGTLPAPAMQAGVPPTPTSAGSAVAASLLPASLSGAVRKALMDLLPPAARKDWGFLFGPLPNPAEPAPDHGELYLMTPTAPNGQSTILKLAGQTTPTGDDTPAAAVVNNRVVLGVEGIDGQISSYTQQFTQLLDQQEPGSVDLGQPMLVVHEGTGQDRAVSMERIARDYLAMKEVQRGDKGKDAAAFKVDPAVQTTYNLLKQQLDHPGRDVMMVVHSGGGAESALALTLLAHDGYQDAIAQHVRVASFAGVASPQDYNLAGVPLDNVLYVGDRRDAVAIAGSHFVDPKHPLPGLESLKKALAQKGTDFSLGTVHSLPNIVALNHNHVQSFFQGGPGGTFLS